MQTTTICRILPLELWSTEIEQIRQSFHPADFWQPDSLLTIAEVRLLQHFAARTPVGLRKVAILPKADQWRTEVTNSLLKLLEEPPLYLELILFAESDRLLPTVRSRVCVQYANETTVVESDLWSEQLRRCNPITVENAALVEQLLYLQAVTHSGHDSKRIVNSLLPS